MGIQDREYIKGKDPGGIRGPRSATGWLLAANIVIAIVAWAVADRGGEPVIHAWGNFNLAEGLLGFQIWRFVSYSFLHADLLHLLFNMMMLWFCGRILETELGGRRLLSFWILCAIAGALLMSVVSILPGLLPYGMQTPMIGASAAVYGMLAGLAARLPGMRVRLFFPPVELSMRALAGLAIGFSLIMFLASSRNIGGEASHLGGALAGYLLAQRPWLLDLPNFLRPRPRLRPVRGGKPPGSGSDGSANSGRIGKPTREDIDRVIDKLVFRIDKKMATATRTAN